ncbi:unnamed protein product [Prorocentrum cordatum]|uniref:Uncharacterized protein n=1 Tax=Prorocentrum cordatum TaxID=2364126 RepID=A0ABN9Q5T6_9DINO|nr:unnamed protein product [Polarella glacialis]
MARGNLGAGFVHAAGLLAAMERLERVGIPVKFPHPPGLYRLLTGKSWTHLLAPAGGAPAVPATVSLPRGLAERDLRLAARSAVRQLEAVRRLRGSHGRVRRGVAKLGFSSRWTWPRGAGSPGSSKPCGASCTPTTGAAGR